MEVGSDGAPAAESVKSIVQLLTSSAVQGVGPKLAERLAGRFGGRTLVVLRGDGVA